MPNYQYCVYILSNQYNTTLYIGITNNLERRYHEHSAKVSKSFTAKYNINKLVYLEEYNDVIEAIAREKQLKNWHHEWKINLIKASNPEFNNLWDPETSECTNPAG